MTLEDMEIKDAKTDWPFSINSADIKAAIAQDNACCAGANGAMRDTTVDKVRIGLSISYLKFKKNNFWYRYKTPLSLYIEIIALDKGGKFQAGDYYLAKVPNNEIKRRGRAHTKREPKHPRPYETTRRPHYVLVGVRGRVNVGAKLGPRKAREVVAPAAV